MDKKTMVIGASPNKERFSNRAVRSLVSHSVPVVAVGLRKGEIDGVQIIRPFPEEDHIHTVTLYIGPSHQPDYYKYIIGMAPKRVIFNPGTENVFFQKMLNEAGIETVLGCTLVMLANEEY